MKKIGPWELSLEAKRFTRALSKTYQIFWTASGWSIHSSEKTLFLDNMSAPWFILPGTGIAFSECWLVWAHTRRLFASVQSRFDTRPPWWFMTPRTCCLSVLAHGVRTKGRRSVCPRTAKLLSWQSSFCAPCLRSRLALARGGPFNEPGLIHRPESPLRGGVRDTKPQMEPSASARTEWVACGADQTEVPG